MTKREKSKKHLPQCSLFPTKITFFCTSRKFCVPLRVLLILHLFKYRSLYIIYGNDIRVDPNYLSNASPEGAA